MYQVAKVARYEPRLECMAYMGNFDDLLNATQPVRGSSPNLPTLRLGCMSGSYLASDQGKYYLWCDLLQQIDAVLLASLSILRSSRLKKVFEVNCLLLKLLLLYKVV